MIAERMRLKFAATLNDDVLPDTTDPDYAIEYVDIGDVDSAAGVVGRTSYLFSEAPSRARRLVQHGDTVISTVRTYLKAIAPIIHPPPNLVVSTGFAVVRPIPGRLESTFSQYLLRDPAFIAEVESRSVGVSYPAITSSNLGDIAVRIPPLATQRAIADFLDAETARIDALIAAKENLLTILAEKRRALITQAVTRGLDPNVPMRASGIPWLGEIPVHWEVDRSRWLFRVWDERSETGEEELLTVSHLTGVTPRSEKDVNMFEAASTVGYKVCHQGDLVINTMWAWMGAMGVAPCTGIVSPSYHVYRPGERLRPAYVDALVRTPVFAQEVTRFSKGVWSSRLRLYPEGFFEVYLPVPPLAEQDQIIAFIRNEQQRVDILSSAVDRSLQLAGERREAIVAAAVTGQLHLEGVS